MIFCIYNKYLCILCIFYISCMCLCSSPKSLKGTAGGQRRPLTWASKKVSFPQWWSQKSFSHRRESYLRLQIMQILLDSNKVSFSSMNKNNSWAMAHTMTWICKLIYLDTWLDLGHLEILYSPPFQSVIKQTKSLAQRFSDACCVPVRLDQTSPNKIRWYSLSRHS